MSRRTLLTAAAVLLAAAAGAWWAARPAPPDDEAAIAGLLEAAARAAEARDPSAAVAGISEAFVGRGEAPGGGAGEGGRLGRRELKQLVAANALRGTWVAVRPAGVGVSVAGDAATARLALILSRGGAGASLADLLPSQASAWRVEARLAREPEGWRVTAATWSRLPLEEALAGDPAARAAPAADQRR